MVMMMYHKDMWFTKKPKRNLVENDCPCGTCRTYKRYGDCKNEIGCNACCPLGIGFNQHEGYEETQEKHMRSHPEVYKGVRLPEKLVEVAKRAGLKIKITNTVV